MTEPILEVDGLTKQFPLNSGVISRLLGNTRTLTAVRDVSFEVGRGETLALVGESGAGKSTVGNVVTRIHRPTSGVVRYRGNDIHELSDEGLREYRQSVQMVFQDPYSSLDPRYRVGSTIAEPLKIHTDLSKAERRDRVDDLLETVNLDPDFADRYPHELSGGQLQRVSIATALSVDPEFLILDEPVSALDVSVQARILNLLMRLQRERNLSYLFISHDLGVVKHLSDRVAVMYLGEIVEQGETASLFGGPAHPYTEGLLASVPQANPHVRRRGQRLTGEIPSPINPPSGCPFHPRCEYATEQCESDKPLLEPVFEGREASCHHWEDVSAFEDVDEIPIEEHGEATD
ncbi:peptide/nickel transport system ATP-binding protein [Halogranum gelatinilyticum]|uniref:Peptide/nickel transport system ATP-binding protein n=1 Tax=Halogranum gelatinilyticum TaxID=660521 RepID=A0A1G9Z0D5_9EURY|nr:oligopeptide/dipeptide ABC transporter ATP-binding protein [Halogranum gelatinilyticum]SDN14657.1 peptide/nickel transport system ATP-binding protein [Halogranum gelatinilyticum]